MKRKLSLLISLLVLTVTLFACADTSSGNGGGAQVPDKSDNLIFGGDTVTAIISNNTDEKLTYDLLTEMSGTIYELTDSYPGTYPEYKDSTWDSEIVIGETSREISEKAAEHLKKMIKREIRNSVDEDTAEADLVGYTVYSDGKNVAVVWSDWRLDECLSDENICREYMQKVVSEWTIATEQVLTNPESNGRAWLGQCACFMYGGCHDEETRKAWVMLSPSVQKKANSIAEQVIFEWLSEYSKRCPNYQMRFCDIGD